MDHDRRDLVAVGADIEGAEPFGEVEVHLGGAALPVAADGVAQDIFELRTVEGALAGLMAVLMRPPDWLAIFSSTLPMTLSARSHSASAPTRFSGRVESFTTISSKPKSA